MSDEQVLRYLRQPYSRVIVPDEEGGYSAQVLEFDGCFSDGASPKEAYENLEEAARNWLEAALEQGLTPPEPYITQEYSGTVSLRLPKSLHKRAAEMARQEGVSLNQFLLAAIAHRVGMQDLNSAFLDLLERQINRLQGRTYVVVSHPAHFVMEKEASPSIDLFFDLKPYQVTGPAGLSRLKEVHEYA